MEDVLDNYSFTGAASISGFEPLHLLSIKSFEKELQDRAERLLRQHDTEFKWILRVDDNPQDQRATFKAELDETRELLAKYCK